MDSLACGILLGFVLLGYMLSATLLAMTLIYCLKDLCGFSFVCAVFCILVGVLCVAMWILEQFHAFKTLNCPNEGEGEILF